MINPKYSSNRQTKQIRLVARIWGTLIMVYALLFSLAVYGTGLQPVTQTPIQWKGLIPRFCFWVYSERAILSPGKLLFAR